MIAAGVCAGHGSTGKAAQAIGLKPFTAETCLQISAYSFIKANQASAPRLECHNLQVEP
jgi:hypothetical protein